MAPLPLDAPNDPSPERTTLITSNNLPNNNISVISRLVMETPSPAWREALGQELRQFWIAQIVPHITRTV